MAEPEPSPVVRHAAAVDYETVDLAAGLHKGVVLGDDQGSFLCLVPNTADEITVTE
ncbi:hypothetical protein [Haloplanus rubicundus]|uniref:hypothetical protein n=1 Tax=Haloplanus rubicundus TaxID=1547898 RepID=UPI00130062C6|nr:hypothetical protein [Haloplanus rubicundus]